MMIDLTVSVYPTGVHPSVKQHLDEGDHQGEDEPDIHHLDVGSGGKRARNTDEQRSQDKQGGEVDGDHGFKEKVFKEVCSIDDAQ